MAQQVHEFVTTSPTPPMSAEASLIVYWPTATTETSYCHENSEAPKHQIEYFTSIHCTHKREDAQTATPHRGRSASISQTPPVMSEAQLGAGLVVVGAAAYSVPCH